MGSRHRAFRLSLTAVLFGCFFASRSSGLQQKSLAPLSEIPVAIKGGETGDLLRKWYAHGTAAGNFGDYYDNRDGGHSMLNMAPYPQLQKIEYTEEQIKSKQNWGMQTKVLPYVVFGNSSTSAPPTRGGSNVKSYYMNPRGLAFLFTEYVRNNLYIYPEHRDHDPGHNGVGGYGDLFPTNTPYLITSQGSSGSDQVFMRALPYVLAAFRPEVKKKLVQSGMLMPVIQMILRITSKRLTGSKDYLTGKAHPTVFEGRDVNLRAMVEMAHGISLSNIPPIALITAVREDTPINGIDYFDPDFTEKLADTPAVIARIRRGASYMRTIVVSAEASIDLNKRPLKFHWAVLRGDPDKIRIEYLNPSRSVAAIKVPYQGRSPINKDSNLESNRVDIGVFVHNGTYYSPPAFVTFYTLDSEARTYDADGRLVETGYGDGTSTISVADWKGLFDLLDMKSGTWGSRFLRSKFTAEGTEALIRVSKEFQEAHESVEAAQRMLDAARKERDKDRSRLSAARKALNDARRSEKRVLQNKLQHMSVGATELVDRVLQSLLQDPEFVPANARAIEALYRSAGEKSRAEFDKVCKTLVLFGIADGHDIRSLHLTPLRESDSPVSERLTRYERDMVERLNAAALSRIVFPGILAADWRENYVDYRIASDKQWRDVYRYAPDGTPMGWRRYLPDGTAEFNADGLLILKKDAQGRCVRGRFVRYEIETQKNAPFLPRKVKMVPTDETRIYEYEGANDWKGHIKLP